MIPSKYVQDIEEAAEELINDRLAEVTGFSINTLELKDNFVDLDGTCSETVGLK